MAMKAEPALPTRMAERWLQLNPPQDWTNTSLATWERDLHAWRIKPAGTEGYAKAEVTVGGVDTAELDAKTVARYGRIVRGVIRRKPSGISVKAWVKTQGGISKFR